jgi:preprotein translocase subunit YajC
MNRDSAPTLRSAHAPVAGANKTHSTSGSLVAIQVGDWVQTDTGDVGKVASIDATSRTAAILKLDQENLRITSVTFPIDRLAKIEIER